MRRCQQLHVTDDSVGVVVCLVGQTEMQRLNGYGMHQLQPASVCESLPVFFGEQSRQCNMSTACTAGCVDRYMADAIAKYFRPRTSMALVLAF